MYGCLEGKSVALTAPVMGLPQADLSVIRAAARPSNDVGGAAAIGFVPCPGKGAVGGIGASGSRFATHGKVLFKVSNGALAGCRGIR